MKLFFLNKQQTQLIDHKTVNTRSEIKRGLSVIEKSSR